MNTDTPSAPFQLGSECVEPGECRAINLFVARLYTHTEMAMPVHVIHGTRPGPRVFLSAALHGDEINGVEIIRKVMDSTSVDDVCGVLVAVPVVNVFGFVFQSRYLPDRRDLNRSFPGSARGSQASRMAQIFFREVVSKCQYGIDLHTAAPPRTNLPQVRTDLRDPESRRIAEAFGAPVTMGSAGPEGSLRREAARRNIRTLVYEAGEPQRFNHQAITLGVRGVTRALHAIGTLRTCAYPPEPSQRVSSSRWVRASQSGIFRLSVHMGDTVEKGTELGVVSDPFGAAAKPIKSTTPGIVIGHTISPLVHRGDALIHLARPGESDQEETDGEGD